MLGRLQIPLRRVSVCQPQCEQSLYSGQLWLSRLLIFRDRLVGLVSFLFLAKCVSVVVHTLSVVWCTNDMSCLARCYYRALISMHQYLTPHPHPRTLPPSSSSFWRNEFEMKRKNTCVVGSQPTSIDAYPSQAHSAPTGLDITSD